MSVIKEEHRRGVRLAAEEEVHMQKSDGVTGIGQMTAPPLFSPHPLWQGDSAVHSLLSSLSKPLILIFITLPKILIIN